MIFRQLTALGDWLYGKGINDYAVQEAALGLNVQTRLLSWKGDCFWSLNDFVDWYSRLDKGQEDNLNQELQNVILQSEGVVAINSFSGSLNRLTRNYTITYNIATIYSSSFQASLDMAAGVPIGS